MGIMHMTFEAMQERVFSHDQTKAVAEAFGLPAVHYAHVRQCARDSVVALATLVADDWHRVLLGYERLPIAVRTLLQSSRKHMQGDAGNGTDELDLDRVAATSMLSAYAASYGYEVMKEEGEEIATAAAAVGCRDGEGVQDIAMDVAAVGLHAYLLVAQAHGILDAYEWKTGSPWQDKERPAWPVSAEQGAARAAAFAMW